MEEVALVIRQTGGSVTAQRENLFEILGNTPSPPSYDCGNACPADQLNPPMPTPESLFACVDAWVRNGDEAAARELMNILHPRVAAIVRHHLPPREAAEDLVQEVFVKVFRNLATFRRDLPLENWVSRIAVNTCIDRLRAHRRRPELRWTELGPVNPEGLAPTLRAPTPGSAGCGRGTKAGCW